MQHSKGRAHLKKSRSSIKRKGRTWIWIPWSAEETPNTYVTWAGQSEGSQDGICFGVFWKGTVSYDCYLTVYSRFCNLCFYDFTPLYYDPHQAVPKGKYLENSRRQIWLHYWLGDRELPYKWKNIAANQVNKLTHNLTYNKTEKNS